jgi:lipopolysaccharide biosynthesis glycosyltransferase
LKLWFWALPARRVVVLDNDMLVYRNLTWLFYLPLPAHRTNGESALLATLACPKQQAFNSGVMVIAPSLALTVKLQRYAAAAFTRRVRGVKQFKYCEITVGDQSLLNDFFRGRWAPLSPELNVGYRRLHSNHRTAATDNISVLHFAGMRVKPWARGSARHPFFLPAVRAWKQECSSLP